MAYPLMHALLTRISSKLQNKVNEEIKSSRNTVKSPLFISKKGNISEWQALNRALQVLR